MGVLLPSANLFTATLVLLVFSCAESAENVALNKPTAQIDIQYNSPGAVDGNSNPDYLAGSCTHTRAHANAWWMVDLIRSYGVRTIRIQNRDMAEYRLQDFYIYVSATNPLPIPRSDRSLVGQLCLHHQNILSSDGIQEMNCSSNTIHGRYVYVFKPANGALTICEFEVISDEYNPMQAYGSVVYRGQKSSVVPVLSTLLRKISLVRCLMACTQRVQAGVTHYQLDTMSGMCDCFQKSDLVPGSLALTQDDDVILCRVEYRKV